MRILVKKLEKKMLALEREIAERKRAEETLIEAHLYTRGLIEASLDAMVTISANGKITDANRSTELITGISRNKLIGSDFSNYFTNPEMARKGYNKVFRYKYIRDYPLEIKHCDGKVIPILYNASVYKDKQGHIAGVFAAARDITERKKAEEEKQKLQMRLLQAQKMEAIGTLAGGIAHDFNNILSAIIGYTEISLDDVKKETLLHNNLQEVFKAGKRAKDLVKQILAFSRQSEQQLQRLQVNYLAKEALKLLRSSLPTTIEIRQNIQSDSIVLADHTQIHQVLMNLCTNAGYAMQEKGGVLDVKLEDVELDTEFTARHSDVKPGPYMKLTVGDTGCGMQPEVLERAFDPFFTTKKKGEGTGMGLSVVHGIVKNHGGIVTAYSEPGNGSTFNVFLPIIEANAESEKNIEVTIPKGKERILFIDDEQTLVDLGKLMLESLGYKVTAKTSSVEALKLFKSQPDRFDLIITDMTMPNLSGEKLAKEVLAIRPDIPIILCTGFSAKIDKEKTESIGILAFLFKPILKQQMAETIRKVLDSQKEKGG